MRLLESAGATLTQGVSGAVRLSVSRVERFSTVRVLRCAAARGRLSLRGARAASARARSQPLPLACDLREHQLQPLRQRAHASAAPQLPFLRRRCAPARFAPLAGRARRRAARRRGAAVRLDLRDHLLEGGLVHRQVGLAVPGGALGQRRSAHAVRRPAPARRSHRWRDRHRHAARAAASGSTPELQSTCSWCCCSCCCSRAASDLVSSFFCAFFQSRVSSSSTS